MSSLASPASIERWDVGDQTWSRDVATGVFDLVDYRGLGAAQDHQDPLDWAALVGARVSVDDDDRAGRPIALFPGEFRFSPVTGKPLSVPAAAASTHWLPPFGSAAADGAMPQGLRLTAAPLALRRSLSTASLPDQQLAIPAAGKYQFIVSACRTREARLLALDCAQGALYQWLPHAEAWQVLEPAGESALGVSSLGEHAWGMAADDLAASNRVYLPTDDGLAVVSVNLIAGRCEVQTLGHACVGAPVRWNGAVHVPMLDANGQLGVHMLQPETHRMLRIDGPELEPATTRWMRPLADARQIVWPGSRYQLVVGRDDGAPPRATLLPWARGLTPRFERAGPFVSEGGAVWQQCFRRDEEGGRFVFAQVGVSEPEMRSAGELQTAAPPHPVDVTDYAAGEVVYPLLASTATSSVLCARIPHTGSVDRLFSSSEAFTTTFELRSGDAGVAFWETRMARPWATQAFVYAGHLYLYHPDKHGLPGWRLA